MLQLNTLQWTPVDSVYGRRGSQIQLITPKFHHLMLDGDFDYCCVWSEWMKVEACVCVCADEREETILKPLM
jgi:hypothetical protein